MYYRIFNKEEEVTVFKGNFENYKKRVLEFEYSDVEDAELAIEVVKKSKSMEDLFHSLEVYRINIFREYKDLRIERLELEEEINMKEIESLINVVNEEIYNTSYCLEVQWKSNCVELDLIAYEKENKKIYESVRVYNDGLWTGTGLLSWIRNYLDEKFNLDDLDAEAEELEEER